LWEQARRLLGDDRRGASEIVLTRGTTVALVCEPVFDGGALLGSLLRLTPINTSEGEATAQPSNRKATAGLAGLSDTEQSVAALAIQGFTNRDVAERLFMSRFTVDSHLRSIYRKLGVNSRLALSRAVVGTSSRP
jgi:DNA-binding CsgD family transcriptional regulator